MKSKYLQVMFRLTKEEKELLDKKLKETNLSRRKYLIKCMKGDNRNEGNIQRLTNEKL